MFESKVCQLLQGPGNLTYEVSGFPKFYWFGRFGACYALVMQLLGPNLEDLLNVCKRHFSLKTVALVGKQLLQLLECFHAKNFVHRDLKPDNFVVGTGSSKDQIYLIDFGLSMRYRDPKSKVHIPYRNNRSLTGTARYASVNTHLGSEQSRRDDIESLDYILIYFLKGALPWQGIRGFSREEKYDKIMDCKMTTSVDTLCRKIPRTLLPTAFVRRICHDAVLCEIVAVRR
jgi:serine/threonine protein kinase